MKNTTESGRRCGILASLPDANHTVYPSLLLSVPGWGCVSQPGSPLSAATAHMFSFQCTGNLLFVSFLVQGNLWIFPSSITAPQTLLVSVSGGYQKPCFHTETLPQWKPASVCFEFWHRRMDCLAHTCLCLPAACSPLHNLLQPV